MTRTMSISETGLRLIKAFEGFRPTDRELVTGTRVIGYGHRLYSDMPMRMSKDEAEDRLKLDLESYEDLINSEVHAPLSQGQFDALVSLAFNIGPKAFRNSDTVRALNNGRVLDAADGFDIWRKAKIGEEIYVVDALMRRRTAEKALFLRTDGPLHASGAMLDPKPDPDAPIGPDDELPKFSRDGTNGLVGKAGYDAEAETDEDDVIDAVDDSNVILVEEIEVDDVELEETDIETDEDELVSVDADEDALLTLSEVVEAEPVIVADIEETVELIENSDDATALLDADLATEEETVLILEGETSPSPIAEAADALSERLNKLVDTDDEEPESEPDWPTSLIQSDAAETVGDADETETTRSNLVAFPGRTLTQSEAQAEEIETTEVNMKRDAAGRPIVIDDLAADDAIRAGQDDGDRRILDPDGDAERNAQLYLDRRGTTKPSGGGLWIPLILGALLLGVSFALLGRGATALLNGWGPIAVVTAAVTGGLMLLFALYAAARGKFA